MNTNATIEEVLDELGIVDSFSFDQSNVTYCHTDKAYVEESYQWLQGSGLESNEVIVVVAVKDINAPMYLSDMSVISDLIDYRYFGPDAMIHADSPEEVVRLYQESFVQVDGPEEIASNSGSDQNHTELVVDGDIPPTAIVDVRP